MLRRCCVKQLRSQSSLCVKTYARVGPACIGGIIHYGVIVRPCRSSSGVSLRGRCLPLARIFSFSSSFAFFSPLRTCSRDVKVGRPIMRQRSSFSYYCRDIPLLVFADPFPPLHAGNTVSSRRHLWIARAAIHKRPRRLRRKIM